MHHPNLSIGPLASAVLIAACMAGSALAAPDGPLADDARVGRFSGVLASANRGSIRTLDARGSADVEGRVPNGTRTSYALGSVSKVLTATAVMRLVEEGRIDLSATVQQYLPEYAAKPFAKVTVAQLLSHTAGVPSLYQTEQGLGDEPLDFEVLSTSIHVDALIDQFSGAPLLFEPGARYGYSNSGYILLGRIIEKVTGKPFYAALDSLVLAPAGVSDEFCLCRDLAGHADAIAFERRGDALAPAPVIDPSQTYSAGGIRATPRGLLKWSEALVAAAS